MMVKNRILKFLITDTDDYVGDFTYSPVFPYIGIFKQFFFFFAQISFLFILIMLMFWNLALYFYTSFGEEQGQDS